jgi:phosphotriesterase-related protein
MVLSHNAWCYFEALPDEGTRHFLRVHKEVIPALKVRGVADEQLTAMLVDNPRTILSGGGTY